MDPTQTRKQKALSLTPELVARVHRVGPDLGPIPDRIPMTEADYEALAGQLLRELEDRPFWLFAAGSLIWKPEFEFEERVPATLHGWHRSFCFRITRWRGTPEQPGLMMGIDRGGTCQGIAFRLPASSTHERMLRLLRREITYKPPANEPGWHWVKLGDARVQALAFTASRSHPSYDHRIPKHEVAQVLARACGHWGSCAEYLYNTVTHLEDYGIRDRNLWHLQKLVAEEISKL